MSNIMDIARSSIAAYRTALGITGANIANVNTEGYRRRDVTTSQIGGAQTTVTTLATGGHSFLTPAWEPAAAQGTCWGRG